MQQTSAPRLLRASGTPGLEGAHASTIRRLLNEAPPFRPDATPAELVDEFATPQNRLAAFLALYARGAHALPAVRQGLQHPNWQIRRWSAIVADNLADAETRLALLPLLHDPKAEVRVWAVHALSCERCTVGPNPIDAVPLLLERIERDASMKVRRHAVAMLAHHLAPDPRVLHVLRKILRDEHDRKLRLHAEQGLARYAAAGLRASSPVADETT
jgi:HEAT repeat protein